MPHYNAYDSFKTKKSLDKKQKAKEKALGRKNDESIEFVVKDSHDCGIVIEVRYNDAYVLYNNEIVVAKLRKDINLACNQVVFPGDKVLLDKVNDTFVIQNMVKRTSLLSREKPKRLMMLFRSWKRLLLWQQQRPACKKWQMLIGIPFCQSWMNCGRLWMLWKYSCRLPCGQYRHTAK